MGKGDAWAGRRPAKGCWRSSATSAVPQSSHTLEKGVSPWKYDCDECGTALILAVRSECEKIPYVVGVFIALGRGRNRTRN